MCAGMLGSPPRGGGDIGVRQEAADRSAKLIAFSCPATVITGDFLLQPPMIRSGESQQHSVEAAERIHVNDGHYSPRPSRPAAGVVWLCGRKCRGQLNGKQQRGCHGTRPGQRRCEFSRGSLGGPQVPATRSGAVSVSTLHQQTPPPLARREGGNTARPDDDIKTLFLEPVVLLGLCRRQSKKASIKAHKPRSQASDLLFITGQAGTCGGNSSVGAMAETLVRTHFSLAPLVPKRSVKPCVPSRRRDAAARCPARERIRAIEGSGSAPAPTEVQKQRKRCLRCGGMYLDEENHPNACEFHGHVTGTFSVFSVSVICSILHFS